MTRPPRTRDTGGEISPSPPVPVPRPNESTGAVIMLTHPSSQRKPTAQYWPSDMCERVGEVAP